MVSDRQKTSELSGVQQADSIESGCDVFLTNDNQLANFPDITIDVLP
jgi:hypothetical protein